MLKELKGEIIKQSQEFLAKTLLEIPFVTLILPDRHSKYLIKFIKEKGLSLVIKEDSSSKHKIYVAFIWIGFPAWISINERLLQAGYTGTDIKAEVKVPRIYVEKLKTLIADIDASDDAIPVEMLTTWGSNPITYLPDYVPDPLLMRETFSDIDKYISESLVTKTKTGIILYGSPGNGKTFLVKWLAYKHNIPIQIVTFDNDIKNQGIINTFSHVRNPSIVLIEDFDSYFNLREPVLQNQAFSFDALLNIFDGIYSPTGPVIFILTANNINLVDPALKNRPSRFRIVREIATPSEDIRKRILKNFPNAIGLIKQTKGMSLDQVLDVAARLEKENKNGTEG